MIVIWGATILPCSVPVPCYAATIGMSSNATFHPKSKLNISRQIASCCLSLVFLLCIWLLLKDKVFIYPSKSLPWSQAPSSVGCGLVERVRASLVSMWGCWTLLVGRGLSRQQAVQEVTGEPQSFLLTDLLLCRVFSVSPLSLYAPLMSQKWIISEGGRGVELLPWKDQKLLKSLVHRCTWYNKVSRYKDGWGRTQYYDQRGLSSLQGSTWKVWKESFHRKIWRQYLLGKDHEKKQVVPVRRMPFWFIYHEHLLTCHQSWAGGQQTQWSTPTAVGFLRWRSHCTMSFEALLSWQPGVPEGDDRGSTILPSPLILIPPCFLCAYASH